jgi:nicotinamidase-related amidase
MAGRPFPLDTRAIHLCIDMQRLFAEPSPWHVPWMARVLPGVVELAGRHRERTVFTRFVPPRTPDEATGAWRDYYAEWREVTREHLDPRLLELVRPLAEMVPPARTVDRPVYSAFACSGLAKGLAAAGIGTLIVTGGETDVCVLATVMDAVGAGFRVVLVVDGLCSVSDQTHEALLTLYRERFSLQIETATIADVLSRWND